MNKEGQIYMDLFGGQWTAKHKMTGTGSKDPLPFIAEGFSLNRGDALL